MKKLKLIYVNPIDLIPYVNNNKIHPKEQLLRLASSIQEYGWDVPIVVDSGMVIIKGAGRREVAIMLNLKEVPVFVRDDLTEDQVRASRIADNKSSSLEYDNNKLSYEIKTLEINGFNLAHLSIQEPELKELKKEIDLGLKDFEQMQSEERRQLESIYKPQKELKNSSGELDLSSFDNFKHECPKCGFEWDDSAADKKENEEDYNI